ncbi:MAG: hypothetical protein JWR21_2596 [Herminiimonas sp.]|nr:hypothetical protein [Herminiimonas sp.]
MSLPRGASTGVFRANLPRARLAPSLITLQPSARHGYPCLGVSLSRDSQSHLSTVTRRPIFPSSHWSIYKQVAVLKNHHRPVSSGRTPSSVPYCGQEAQTPAAPMSFYKFAPMTDSVIPRQGPNGPDFLFSQCSAWHHASPRFAIAAITPLSSPRTRLACARWCPALRAALSRVHGHVSS